MERSCLLPAVTGEASKSRGRARGDEAVFVGNLGGGGVGAGVGGGGVHSKIVGGVGGGGARRGRSLVPGLRSVRYGWCCGGVAVVEAREDGAVCQMVCMMDVCSSALLCKCSFIKLLSLLRLLLWRREARKAGFV